jgi:hypothetical protein
MCSLKILRHDTGILWTNTALLPKLNETERCYWPMYGQLLHDIISSDASQMRLSSWKNYVLTGQNIEQLKKQK